MADVDISPNLNTFNFLTAEYEYIKKTGILIQLAFVLKMLRYPYESNCDLESKYISLFAIEYKYNYPVRDIDLGPFFYAQNAEL